MATCSSSIRYERLQTDDVEEPDVVVVLEEVGHVSTSPDTPTTAAGGTALPLPPMYTDETGVDAGAATGGPTDIAAATSYQTYNSEDDGRPKFDAPPSYHLITDLPSYEEAERLKQAEETYPSADDEQLERLTLGASRTGGIGPNELGSDGLFLLTFLLSFLFNWVGFLFSYCLSTTIAGRYGAISGFGLSIIKWSLIMHVSNSEVLTDRISLWWLLLVIFGVTLFLRGVFMFMRIKQLVRNGLSHNPNFSLFLY